MRAIFWYETFLLLFDNVKLVKVRLQEKGVSLCSFSTDIVFFSVYSAFLFELTRICIELNIYRGLRSYYGNAEDNVDQKMNLFFTYESRDTLKSFTLFLFVKNLETGCGTQR